ncbi:MAG TPA: TIGR03435 family protein [Acidobacteriaceae bacterium]|nr:TIGR03435 family protein [Acidobacteriaceae bacterium]
MTTVARWVLLAGFAVVCCSLAVGQANPSPLTYDVVSVRPSDPNVEPTGINPLPNGVGYNGFGVTVREMLCVMYRLPERQIIGGPDWVDSAKFDVLVRANHRYSIDELHMMFQNMLADRFKLRSHIQIKQGPIYALTVAKSGLKMTPVEEGFVRNSPIQTESEDVFTADRVPMNYLCFWLSIKLEEDHRPVVDLTGLTGHYDFRLSFRPQLPPEVSSAHESSLPSIFDAVKDQLGLLLTPRKGPIQMLVIDQVEKPTEN